MTTRPGQPTVESLRWLRGKHLCHCIRVIRQDGVELLLTDHDRQLTFEGRVYTPINFGAMSAERREGALRSGNQEATGWIDGSVITMDDMDANRYRGAEVYQATVDWRFPWLVPERHRKFIRSITRTGSSWVGTLEGRTQILQRPAAGRFGGTFTTTCPYELGGVYCKKDISADVKTPITVDAVIDTKRTCEFDPTGFTGTYADDYYRDGSIVWLTGNNAGHVSPIVEYLDADKQVSFLFPTPKVIQVGDTATVKPGCDGLFSTCKSKFSNQLNHGGDPFAPSASQIIEPVEET